MNKPTMKDRFQYWFDTKMSRGSIGLIRILIIFTVLAVLLSSGLILLFHFAEEGNFGEVLWNSIATIINAWMPSYEEGSFGYLLIMSLTAFAGLLFTSVLIGIVTSAIEEKIVSLRRGNSRVLEKDHIVILGFTPGEYTLIAQLVLAAGSKPQCIVVGADLDKEELENYIRENVDIPSNVRIICRTVDIFDPVSIEKCGIEECRTVIISPTDDNSTVKALLAVSTLIDSENGQNIRVNAIVSKDECRIPQSVARRHNVRALQTNETLSRIIAHSCTQTGLSETFEEIFNFEGSELYIVSVPGTEGMTFRDVLFRLDGGVPIGILHNNKTKLNPPGDSVILEEDRLVIFAEESGSASLSPYDSTIEVNYTPRSVLPDRQTKAVIFGCNRALRTVLRELPDNVTQVTLVNVEMTERETNKIEAICAERNIEIRYYSEDPEDDDALYGVAKNAEHIVLLSNHRIDPEEADMETIFLLLNLRDIRERYRLSFNITAEMHSEKNQRLAASDDFTDFIVSSNMSSLFLAQLAESPELIGAFREILSNEGSELYIRKAPALHGTGMHSVRELRQIIAAQGYIFLGYRTKDHTNVFNPSLDTVVNLSEEDSLIVFGES